MRNIKVTWAKRNEYGRTEPVETVVCFEHRKWPKEQPGFIKESWCAVSDEPCEVCEQEKSSG